MKFRQFIKFSKLMSDRLYLTLRYKHATGKKIHWKKPVEFNEKLLWLMVNDHRPLYKILVDKLAVKKYVADLIGEEHVIPLIATGDCFDDIDVNSLPNQFVIKNNHDSGGVVVCKDKNTFDFDDAKRIIDSRQEKDFYLVTREWPYRDIPKKVIVEKYMEDSESKGELRDYKFYCFNGEPKFLYLSQGLTNHATAKISYLDLEWNRLAFYRKDYKQFDELPMKPSSLQKMIELSSVLSNGIPFVRVDLYEIDGNVYFGEMTLYPGAGMTEFYPDEWNKIIGEYISLKNESVDC